MEVSQQHGIFEIAIAEYFLICYTHIGDCMENLKILNIIEGPAALQGSFRSRPSHALVFKLSGESVYHFENETLRLCQGEMLFVPRGAAYSFSRVGDFPSRYVLINFLGELDWNRPEKHRLDDRMDFSHFCSRLCRCRILDAPADRYRALSLFYEVLSCLSESRKAPYLPVTTVQKIDPAVECLRENIFDPALKIGSLHTLCGISDTYFRQIFISRFGISPKKYVLTKRLCHAKAVLDHGECGSVGEAALLAGFDDPLYFSKVFKKTYGYPPSKKP